MTRFPRRLDLRSDHVRATCRRSDEGQLDGPEVHPTLRSSCVARRRRRGVSLLLVLGLVAIALATSYALLRTQATSMQLQGNAGRQVDARQAAFAGLSAALRRMHEPDWGGVAVPL